MPELRKDPVVDRWVIIAAERGRRPSDFVVEPEPAGGSFSPFSTGHEDRTPPEIMQIGRPRDAPPNSPGWRVRVVPNKFPALNSSGLLDYQGQGMYDLMNGIGAHEIIIDNPNPDWDMAEATHEEMRDVFTAYVARALALRQDERFRYVLIFRNQGAAAGASLAHPHSQVIALPIVPKQIKEQLDAARDYYHRKSRCIYSDIMRQEIASGERVVELNDDFVVLSPFAARFPFELQIFPRRFSHDFATIGPDEMIALADTLSRTLRRIKRGLNDPAYNLMLHTAPIQNARPGRPGHWGTIAQDYLWRIDILPRLTKIAGFEWGTGFYINPVAPEQAADVLKNVAL